MHPAFSVIFFTTATGAGYGLLALLGVTASAGLVPASRGFAVLGLGLALGLITAGLLSSTLHLTHPERAWRAFSQWRSSWLSREGVLSVATYVPAGFLGLGWIALGRTDGFFAGAGLLAALCSVATVITTGMIYASLKPVPAWHNRFTVPIYLLLAAMTGAVLLNALLHLFGAASGLSGGMALATVAAAWAIKTVAWRANDRRALPASTARATGLAGGEVRSVEWPHTEENYVLKEMGFRIGRKHARKLRAIAHILAFALPLAATALALLANGWLATAAALLAAVSTAPGVLVERWLFFAEAKHIAAVYYGR